MSNEHQAPVFSYLIVSVLYGLLSWLDLLTDCAVYAHFPSNSHFYAVRGWGWEEVEFFCVCVCVCVCVNARGTPMRRRLQPSALLLHASPRHAYHTHSTNGTASLPYSTPRCTAPVEQSPNA